MKLYLLGLPIGRLNDVSITLLETLSRLNYLAVEDTRSASQFLRLLAERFPEYRLWPKELIAYYKENERSIATKVIAFLEQGHEVGLMSEAGMPAVADPGSYLVHETQRRGIAIEVIPGPSALTAALSLSGFEAGLTLFTGFLPKKPKLLMDLLNAIPKHYANSINLVFFESPFRIRQTVRRLLEGVPQAKLFLGRELTKKHQQLIWIETPDFDFNSLPLRGEYTGVLHFKVI